MEKLMKLYEYQQVDADLYAIESSLKKADSRKRLAKAKTILLDGQKTAESYEKEIEGEKKQIEATMSQYEALNQAVQTLTADSEKAKSVEEAREIKKRAEKLSRDLKALQSKIIAGLNQVNDTQKKYHELMLTLQKAKQEFIEQKEIATKEQEAVKGQMEELKAKLNELAKTVDAKLLELYVKKRKTCMPVIVKLESDQCMGCYMKLPSLTVDHMKKSQEIVECENCGRILLVD